MLDTIIVFSYSVNVVGILPEQFFAYFLNQFIIFVLIYLIIFCIWF